MFAASPPAEVVAAFGASIRAFHPVGFRAMARASAGNVRDVLPRIQVPTLLLYGDADVRAPLPVAEDLHRSIPGARLVLLPGVGHVTNIEAPEAFNEAVRSVLGDLPEGA
jgi:pimeloyl-ACP methyl ester carboxylesterase